MGPAGSPLSDGQADEMKAWVIAAGAWAEAAQALVGAANDLAIASRDLGDRLDPAAERGRDGTGADDIASLAAGLALLADAVERETRQLRDGYLRTAANLEQYRMLLD